MANMPAASGLTAAHRTLPFGTMVRVTNQRYRPFGRRAHQRSRAVRPRPRHRRHAGGRPCAGLFRPRAGDAGGARQDLRQAAKRSSPVPYGVSQSFAASSDKRRSENWDELQRREASASRFFIRAAAEPIGNHIVHTQATIVGQHCRSPPRAFVSAMAPTETVPAFQARLALYRIDDQTRSLLAQTWPTIAPHLDRVIDEVVRRSADLPNIGAPSRRTETWSKSSRWRTSRLCSAGKLDQRYAESCRQTVRAGGRDRAGRAHAQHRREFCAQGRVRRARAQAPLFLRHGSPARQERIASHQLRRRQRHDPAPAGGGASGIGPAQRDRRGDSGLRRCHRRGDRRHQGSLRFADRRHARRSRGLPTTRSARMASASSASAETRSAWTRP